MGFSCFLDTMGVVVHKHWTAGRRTCALRTWQRTSFQIRSEFRKRISPRERKRAGEVMASLDGLPCAAQRSERVQGGRQTIILCWLKKLRERPDYRRPGRVLEK